MHEPSLHLLDSNWRKCTSVLLIATDKLPVAAFSSKSTPQASRHCHQNFMWTGHHTSPQCLSNSDNNRSQKHRQMQQKSHIRCPLHLSSQTWKQLKLLHARPQYNPTFIKKVQYYLAVSHTLNLAAEDESTDALFLTWSRKDKIFPIILARRVPVPPKSSFPK